MTPREPDRFEPFEEWSIGLLMKRGLSQDMATALNRDVEAALRRERDDALNEAAREVEAAKSSDRFAVTQAILARRIRALASPAAAPAAEPSEPVAPSLLPRVLAVLDAEYRRRGGDDGGGYVGVLADELRRYIAEMEGKT